MCLPRLVRLLRVLWVLVLVGLSCVASAYDSETLQSIESITAPIDKAVNTYGAERVLVVFDIDNTLLTMPSSLGGTGWFEWQFSMLGKNSSQSVARTLKV